MNSAPLEKNHEESDESDSELVIAAGTHGYATRN